MLVVYLHQIQVDIDYHSKMIELPLFLQQKLKKRKNKQKVLASLVGYLLLQKALKDNFDLGLTNLKYQKNGKPYLEGEKCFFSISHSSDRVVVAITDIGDLGIDIEPHRILPKGESVFAFFSEVEQKEIAHNPTPNNLIIEYWSKKEALVKAVGGQMFDMANYTDVRSEKTTWENKSYYLYQLGNPPEIHIWLAISKKGAKIVIKDTLCL